MGEHKRRAANPASQEKPKVLETQVVCDTPRGRKVLTLKVSALGEAAIPGSEHQKSLINAAIEALGKSNPEIKVVSVGDTTVRPN